MSASLPAASASVHQEGANSSRTSRPPAASAAAMRASVVRFLVDDEALSMTDVARKMGVSGQAVARLYRSDVEEFGAWLEGLVQSAKVTP